MTVMKFHEETRSLIIQARLQCPAYVKRARIHHEFPPYVAREVSQLNLS